jgi:hypothetical protein
MQWRIHCLARAAVTLASALVADSLGGCGSDGTSQGLGFLVGQSVEFATSGLGPPDTQRSGPGITVYVWGNSDDARDRYRHPAPVQVARGGSGQVVVLEGYIVPAIRRCTIELTADSHNVIRSWQWHDVFQRGACARLYSKANFAPP